MPPSDLPPAEVLTQAEADSRLARRMAVSSVYAIGARFGMRGIGLISMLVMVRILLPQDFGIVALAQAVYLLLDVLTTSGFGLAIIRMRAPTREHYDTAWTLGLGRGAFIAVCLIASARWQAEFMHEPRIEPVMWVLAATSLVNVLPNIRLLDYQRDMRFDLLTRWQLLTKLLGFTCVLGMVIFIRNYWAIVLGSLLARSLVVLASYMILPHRPRLCLSGWRELFHFSKWLFLGNIGLLADKQLMNFVVGHYLGMVQVGLFQVGQQIAALPVTEIAEPIRQPLYAGLARIRDDLAQLRQRFLDGFAVQCAIILPLTVGVCVTAPEITAIFLGPRWAGLVSLLPVIAVYALLDGAGSYVHTILMVTNRQRLYTLTYYVSISLRLPLTIWWAVEYGLYGAALAMLVTSAFNAVIWNAQVNRILRLRWWEELASSWRIFVSAGVMAAGVAVLAGVLRADAGISVAARLALESAAGGALYIGLLSGLWYASGLPDGCPEAYAMRLAQAGLRRGWRYATARREAAL